MFGLEKLRVWSFRRTMKLVAADRTREAILKSIETECRRVGHTMHSVSSENIRLTTRGYPFWRIGQSALPVAATIGVRELASKHVSLQFYVRRHFPIDVAILIGICLCLFGAIVCWLSGQYTEVLEFAFGLPIMGLIVWTMDIKSRKLQKNSMENLIESALKDQTPAWIPWSERMKKREL